MKRKSKASSIKGTPPITKFFKRSSDVKSKAKPLTAILEIPDLSNSKCTAVVKSSESNTYAKVAKEVKSKVNIDKIAVGNKAIVETKVLDGKNVDDLVLIAENFITKEFEETEEGARSRERRTPQKVREECSELSSSAAEKFPPGESWVLLEKETEKEEVCFVSAEKIQNGCLKKSVVDSHLSESELKPLSTKRLESEERLCYGENQKRCSSNSENELQYFPVTSEESFPKEDFPCETLFHNFFDNVLLSDKNSVNNITSGATQLLHGKNSLNGKAVTISHTTNDVDICTDHIGNSEKGLPKETESNPIFTSSASCEEILGSLSNDNSCSNQLGTNEAKETSVCAIEVSMDDQYRPEPSYEMDQETNDYFESKMDITTRSGVKTDDEVNFGDCSHQGSDSEMENMNEKKIANLDTGNGARDPRVVDSPEEMQGTHEGDGTSSGEQSENDDESSDDELLNPVFLCDNRVKPEVRTPEKTTTPIMGSPLCTPISPFIAKEKNVPRRLKYSLDKLLSQKPKQAEKHKAMAELQLAMQKTIEAGKNAGIAEDVVADEEDDDKALLPISQKELKRFEATDKGFSEKTSGLNIFPWLKQPIIYVNGCRQPFPAVEIAHVNEFTKSLYRLSDLEIRELICSDWITNQYPLDRMPSTVIQWLYHILCYHIDNHTVNATFNTLWSILYVGDSKEKRAQLSWTPGIENVLKVFIDYGANLSIPYAEQDLFKMACKLDAFPDAKQERGFSLFPLENFIHLIQFLALCVAQYPQSYSAKDTEHLVVVLCGISLDTRMQICHHDIKKCLQALYSAVEPNYWAEEVTKISSVIHRTASHHRDKLRIIQLQPYSSRGRDVKRLAALQLMASLLNNVIIDVKSFVQSDVDMNKNKEITNTNEVFTKLEMLLHEVPLNDDTDYYQLYTIIELLDITVGAENLLPSEKPIVEKITKKLRDLHSSIKDPKAMFISRTMVKDLILRTVTKFGYMTQGKKISQSQGAITKFFVEGKSDLCIETLKESELEEEDEEETTSQTTEYSDDESLLESQELPIKLA